jgi:hypothetical protein
MFKSASKLFLAVIAVGAIVACGQRDPKPGDEAHGATDAGAAPRAAGAVTDADTIGSAASHEDHDEHDHEDASGAGHAHVHGVAELALTREGASYVAELETPLANFGLSESGDGPGQALDDALARLVTLEGGNCVASPPNLELDRSGGHAEGHIRLTWTCAQPGDVAAMRFAAFREFPGFEKVDAVFLSDNAQKAATLTPQEPELRIR